MAVRCPRSADLSAGELCVVKFANQRRHDMGAVQVEIVARPIQVGRHR